MNEQQMKNRIECLERRIKDLEEEVEALRCQPGPPAPLVDVGAARLRPPMIIAVGTPEPPRLYRRHSRRTDGLPENASGKADAPFNWPRDTAGNPL